MKRFFTLVLEVLALVAVALISAFIAMRLAIHGREAVVPNLSGLTVAEASNLAARQGLALTLENSFYSAEVPAGRILTQDPAAGSRVRREWPVRITESLGAQRIAIPDLTGETERSATVGIRRLSLEMGTVSHLAIAGGVDAVLAQTPPANAGGADSPRISLLVSDAAAAELPAYAMPSLAGLSYSAASTRAASAGLHLMAAMAAPSATPAPSSSAVPDAPSAARPLPTDNPPISTARSSSIVIAQSPEAGSRVVAGDVVHVTLGRAAAPAAVPAAPQ